MPWVIQMVGFGLLLLGIAFALWVSLWLLVILFGLGVCAVVYSHIRSWLIEKGIVNPPVMKSGEASHVILYDYCASEVMGNNQVNQCRLSQHLK